MKYISSVVLTGALLAIGILSVDTQAYGSHFRCIPKKTSTTPEPIIEDSKITPETHENLCSKTNEYENVNFKKSGEVHEYQKGSSGECPIKSKDPQCNYFDGFGTVTLDELFPLCWFRNKTEGIRPCQNQKENACPPEFVDISKVCPRKEGDYEIKTWDESFIFNYIAYPGFTTDPDAIGIIGCPCTDNYVTDVKYTEKNSDDEE